MSVKNLLLCETLEHDTGLCLIPEEKDISSGVLVASTDGPNGTCTLTHHDLRQLAQELLHIADLIDPKCQMTKR